MNRSEALDLAIEMLERVAPGRNYETRDFYEKLHEIKSTILPDTTNNPAPGRWPRTAIVCGEEFYEVGQRTTEGRDLLLLESNRDGSEAPAIIVDAKTHEIVMDEVYNGFRDYRDEQLVTRQKGKV
jgi:hypothetical protein